jgi:hypothetical protein
MPKVFCVFSLIVLVSASVFAMGHAEKSAIPAPAQPEPTVVKPQPVLLGYFTKDMYDSISTDKLKNVKFYLSEAITLTRQNESTQPIVTSDGGITMTQTKGTKVIEVKARTLGRLESLQNGILGISFDSGNPNALMNFAYSKDNGLYYLVDGRCVTVKNGDALKYDGVEYTVSIGTEYPPVLMVQYDSKINTVDSSPTVLQGWE